MPLDLFGTAAAISPDAPNPHPAAPSPRAAAPRPLSFRLAGSVLAVALALSACAQLPRATPDAGTTNSVAANANAAPAGPAAATTPETDPTLPRLDLTPDILYQLLAAEVAAQRGLSGPAFATLQELATRTRDPRIARRAFEIALQARQMQGALVAARLWSELAPDNTQAREALFNLLVQNNQFNEAETRLRADLAKSANPAQNFGAITAILARSNRRIEALAVIEGLAADYPRLPEAHFAVAQLAQLANQKPRAMQQLREALALRPDWELAALVGAQFLQADAPGEASDFLRKFLETTPSALSARLALGRLLASQQRYPEATTQLRQVLERQPENTEALYTLGLIAAQTGKADEAEGFFKRYVDLAQKNPRAERSLNRAWLQLAQIEEERKNIDGALGYLGRVRGGEEYIPARARRANLLARSGRLDQARQELRDAGVESARDRVQLVQIEAQVLRDAGRYQEAFDFLEDSLKTYPDESDLLYDHAMLAEKLDRVDTMEKSLRSVIRLRPDAAQAYNALGYSLADRKLRLSEALNLIERALALTPDDPAIIDSMGWVQYRLGNLTVALDYLQRAWAARPDTEVGTHLGEVLWVMGRRTEAQAIWREAGRREPDNQVLRETLQRLNAQLGN